MKALAFILLAIGLAVCKDFSKKNGSLDPGRITWPKEEWHNNPIDLSQTNSGTYVTFTFNFRPSTKVTDGIVQIIFPLTFPSIISPVNANMGSSQIEAGVDMSVTTMATLPSNPGFVGPFGLVTRSSQTGQIVDANYVFGCIAISDPDIPSNTLSVTSLANTNKIGSSDSFTIHFPISKSLWKHDIIEIIPPKDWSPTSSPLCYSSNGSLIGPNGSSSSSLPCSVGLKSTNTIGVTTTASSDSTKNAVYVYGISRDVWVSYTTDITFTVSGFNLPQYVVSTDSSLNTWEVKIWRFGTNNLLWHFTGRASFSMIPGTPRIISWVPHASASSAIIQGMTTFTDLSIYTENNIPASGTLSVTFSGVNIFDTKWWSELDGTNSISGLCYLSPYINGTSCSVDSSQKVTIKFNDYQTPKTFTITVLTNFNTDSPSVSQIVSKTEQLAVIDSSSEQKIFQLSTTDLLLSYCNFFGYDSFTFSRALTAGHIEGGVLGKKLYFIVKPGGSTTWGNEVGATIVFNLDYTSSLSFKSVYIGSEAKTSEKIDTLASSVNIIEGNTIFSPKFRTTSNEISGEISAGSSNKVSPSQYYVLVYSSSSYTSLPFVASNVATFYEMQTKVEYSTGTTHEYGRTVFSVMPQTTKDKLYGVPLCTDAVFGIPIVVYYEPINMSFDYGDTERNFAIVLDIENGYDPSTGFMGTLIKPGDLNPGDFYSTALGATATISATTVIDNGTIKYHGQLTLRNLGKTTYSADQSTQVYSFVPNYVTAVSSYKVNVTFVYSTTEDPTVQNVLYQNTTTWSFTSPSSSSISTASMSSTLNIGDAGTLTTSINFGSSSTISSTDTIGIGMTKGIRQQSPVFSAVILDSTYSSQSPYYASSNNDFANGAFVMASNLNGYTGSSDVSSRTITLKANNVYPAAQTESTDGKSATTFSVFIAGSTYGQACKASKTISGSDSSVTINTGKIKDANCTMIRSSDVGLVDASLEIVFTPSHDITAYGLIELSLGSSSFGWANTDGITTCSSSVLTPADGNSISCAVSSTGVMTVSNFSPVTAGTAISISVKHVLPTSSSTLVCFTLITTQASPGKYIDAWQTSVPVVVDGGGGSTGVPTYRNVEVFPNNAGLMTDLYMEFSLSKAVPAKGTITIVQTFSPWSYDLGTIQDFCWSNIDYLACKIVNFNLVITLSQNLPSDATVQLYIDSAFVLPKIPGKTISGIKIQADWAKTTIASDTTSGYFLEVGPKVSSSITISKIVLDITNVGESATYNISYVLGNDIEVGDYMVFQFPRSTIGSGFDPFLGDAVNQFSVLMPDQYELPCKSSTLGSISCYTSHWYLTVTGISALIPAGKSIDLAVSNIRNPYMITDGKFSVWHYNSTDDVKAFGSTSQYNQTTNPSKSKVMLKEVSIEDESQGGQGSYYVEFYPSNSSEIFTSDILFIIAFPEEFNFDFMKSSSIACSSSLCSNSANSTYCNKTWNSNQICTVSGNKVMLSIQSQSSVRMTETSSIYLTLPMITNPSSGLSRTKDSSFDTKDTSTFGSYNFWSSKFWVGVWDTSKQTLSRSYGLLNSGYLGFTQESSSIAIDYPGSAKRIALIPGQQSDDIHIKISNSWPSVDKSIKFIPSISGTGSSYLKITSPFYNFVLKQMYPEIVFRVAASQGIPNGLYYIDWTLSENPQVSGVNMYNPPASTLIEVHTNPDKIISITVAKIPKLYAGYSSVPVCVTLDNAPATNLIITPTFDVDSSGITANPSSLVFVPDKNTLCFTIDVASNYASVTGTTVLSFPLSGSDFNIFKQPDNINLVINTLSTSPVQANLQIQSTVKDDGSVSISAQADYDVIIYWYAVCKGSDIHDFSTVVDNAPSLTNSNSTGTLKDDLAKEYADRETDVNPNEGDTDIMSFFDRQHAEHCETLYISSQVAYAKAVTTITLDFLMGGTDYTFVAYADHKLLTDYSLYQPKVLNFTTSALSKIMKISVSIYSSSDLAAYTNKIQNTLATYMGINPSWLLYNNITYIHRALQGRQEVGFTILYDRQFPTYSSSKIIDNFSKNEASAMEELIQELYSSSNPSYTVSLAASNSGPNWDFVPAKKSFKDKTVKFTFTSSIDGRVYAACYANGTSDSPLAWQLRDGLDASNRRGRVNSVEAIAHYNQTVNITGLTPGETYYCYLTACNNYPMWPTCMEATGDSALTTMARIVLDGHDDGSEWILIGLSFIMIFN